MICARLGLAGVRIGVGARLRLGLGSDKGWDGVRLCLRLGSDEGWGWGQTKVGKGSYCVHCSQTMFLNIQ